MIKRIIIITILLISAGAIVSAQDNSQTVVYLKDGSSLRGYIIAQFPDSIVKIEIAGGSVFVVTMQELDHIDYKSPLKYAVSDVVDTPVIRKDHGYFNITEIGLLPGTNYSNDYYYYGNSASTTTIGFTLQTIHGYRFNNHFSAGAGVAIDIIQYPMVQLFADARWEFLKGKTTPFLYVDGGYGIPLNNGYHDSNGTTTYTGGITAGGGFGMRINFHSEGAFLVEAGYKMEKRSEHIENMLWGIDQSNNFTYSRLAIRFGMAF